MKAPVNQAVLLVGGQGTRLRPLTCDRPKALVPLLNEPLLACELRLLARHGITNVILSVGYRARVLQDALGDGSRWGVRLRYVEEPSALGTAGGLRNALELLDGPFVAMNGDLVYDVDLSAFAEAHLRAGAMVSFCLRRVEDIRRFGLIQCDDSGRVVAFREKREVDETGRNTVNSGVYLMDPEALLRVPAGVEWSNETQLFPGLLQEGCLLLGFMPEQQGYWADVGTVESYLQTSRDLLRGAIPWMRGAVATSVMGRTEDIEQPVGLAEGVRIEDGARVGPEVCIGARGTVGAGARIQASILWEDVTIGPNAHIHNCIIGAGVTIGAGCKYSGKVVVR
ncbi:MAG: NDP-sugar synthase [Armatimonadetes bacterium]|nr:NDP-sugar synthase [Armatimonadota bacterium]